MENTTDVTTGKLTPARPPRSPASPADMEPLTVGGAARQVAHADEKAVDEKRERTPESDDGMQMPPLEELVAESGVAQDLNEKARREAFEIAKRLKFGDPLTAMNFGLEEQEAASRVTKKFIDDVRMTDLEAVAHHATEGNRVMEQLEFGNLKPGFWEGVARKVLPGRASKVVEDFISKHQALSEVLDERSRAYAEEKLKLEEARKKADAKKVENEKIYDELSKKVAAAEFAHAADKKRVEEFKHENESTRDPALLRRIQEMDKMLTLQARRINTLKASRTEINNATATFSEQIDAIDLQIQMINDQQYFNRLVWENTALMAMIDAKTRGSVQAVKYNRETIEKLLSERSDSVAETVQRILEEAHAGVVDVGVLEAVTLKNIQMNAARIKGYHDIREKMKRTGEVMEELDRELKAAQELSAAASTEDLDAVLEHVQRVEESLRHRKDGGGASGSSGRNKPLK